MKIIRKDIFDRDTVADRLVADNIKTWKEGDVMVKALNEEYSGCDCWYVLRDDDYVLWRGMEELV